MDGTARTPAALAVSPGAPARPLRPTIADPRAAARVRPRCAKGRVDGFTRPGATDMNADLGMALKSPVAFVLAEHEKLTAIRRDLHAHPEIGFEEHRTAALVAERLHHRSVEVHTGVGRERVARQLPPSMGAEDFAFMLQARPGCYARLGQGGSEGSCWLHNSRYDFNDAVIPLGAGFLAALAERRMPLAEQRSA
jgi:hypothetical protein